MVLILMCIYVFYAFGMMSQLLTNEFDETGDRIQAFDWHLFSYKIQRMFLITLVRALIPVELRCFGSVSATREYSKKVSFDPL